MPEPVSSGRKRYSAQRQKPTMTTAVETPMQPVAIPETSARETQIIYVTPQGKMFASSREPFPVDKFVMFQPCLAVKI